MARPVSAYTEIDDSHWVAGTVLREGNIRTDLIQNITYLVDLINSQLVSNFWANYEQRLQLGQTPGSPFA